MSIKWLVFFFTFWALLVVFGMGVEQTFAKVTGAGEYKTVVDTLMSMRIFSEVTIGGATVGWLPNVAWFSSLGKVFTFQFTFMTTGPIGWLGYWLVLIPISLSMIIATLFAARGSPSS